MEDCKMQVVEEQFNDNNVNTFITPQENTPLELEQGKTGKVEDSVNDAIEGNVSNGTKTEETVSDIMESNVESDSIKSEIDMELKDSKMDIKTESCVDSITNHVDIKKKEDESN